ncbi:LegC family aminotransferase [Fusobacterium russii]|uniref:LegC family aminotransferase n=1 Tax=Fusobacterium russii TaxID=854 RepID=UPI0009D9A7F4
MSTEEIRDKIQKKIDNKKTVLYILPNIEDLDRNKSFISQLRNINIPLSVPNLNKKEILRNLEECLESGWVSTGGKFIPEFEKKVSKYLKIENTAGVQSGTAGLHMSLQVLGVKKDEEVIVPTLTFIAAVNPVTYLGANPVFIDCDDSLCIDPLKLEKFCSEECDFLDGILRNKKTKRKIKILVVVHVFGNMADMEKIMDIAKKYNLKVLEDATEAFGTYYIEGKYKGKFAGTIGDLGVLSFNANKIITTGGGGMVVGGNYELVEKARFLSSQAKKDPLYFIHDEIGYNYRMLNLQAALGTSQIDELESFIETKMKNYYLYKEELSKIDGLELMSFRKGIRPNYWFYSLVVNKEKYGLTKDELLKKLVSENIQTRPIWGLIHQQKPYKNYEAYRIEKALWYYDRVLNIPCSSNLTEKEVQIVIEKLSID